jgi:high-affinity iron transporter
MLAALLIVFREVLEAALIVGIVAAATKGVPGRGRWIVAGIAAGGLGAIVVAGFASTIAAAFEGGGQEVFTATVLFAAVVMLGWHNVWMSHHGREMAREMSALGAAVSEGTRELYVVGIAVGLAVLREGSEVVLFLYGIAGSGASDAALMMGGVAGLALGTACGFALYKGLLRLSTRPLFAITGWLILLLAAGMAGQGANFLVQAGYLPSLGPALWDSSQILSEQSWIGFLLHTLIGYTARPSGIQLLFYLATLLVIGALMKLQRGRGARRITAAIATLTLATPMIATPDNPAKAQEVEVYSPHVDESEAEIEYGSYYGIDHRSNFDNGQVHKLSFGYGVNAWWFTELYANLKRDAGPDQPVTFDSWEWENRFQLTEPGANWADLGLLMEYERVANHRNDADELAIGPLIEKDIGPTTETLDVEFLKQIGPYTEKEKGVDLAYRAQARWRLMPEFEPGFQAFGNFGRIGAMPLFNRQEHAIGPALLGYFQFGGLPGRIGYNLAYLFGATSAAPHGAFKTILEYEFRY